jgi:chemotaxis protein MotB
MGRRRPSDDLPGGANWMDTYGDLVTLLLTFFVLLYSFSSIDAAKWQVFVRSFSGSSQPIVANSAGKTQSVDPNASFPPRGSPAATETEESADAPVLSDTIPAETTAAATTTAENTAISETSAQTQATTRQTTARTKPTEDPQIQQLYSELNAYFQGSALGGKLTVERQNSKILIRLVASVIFEAGSDQLRPDAAATLDGAAALIRGYAAQIEAIRTEGHTDSVTPPTGDIESKWELAARRSARVLQRILTTSGLDPNLACTIGYGSTRPVADNDTPEGQDQNNRVDVILIT